MEMGTLTGFTCSGYSPVVSSSAHVNELKTWCSHSSVPEIQVFWDVMFCHGQSIADISKNQWLYLQSKAVQALFWNCLTLKMKWWQSYGKLEYPTTHSDIKKELNLHANKLLGAMTISNLAYMRKYTFKLEDSIQQTTW